MSVAGYVRSRTYAEDIAKRAETYNSGFGRDERLALQLEAWNREWQKIRVSVPYFQRLSAEFNLPSEFHSWQDFLARMPVMTKATIQAHHEALSSLEKAPDRLRATGGSTAEPITIPSWNSEERATKYDTWLGRSWYGISPSSRLFMLWGHSHLLGSGVSGYINAQRRKLYDRLLGYRRFSAYDLQPAALSAAARELIRYRPDYIIGYSVALYLFARLNNGLRKDLSALGLKAVIATGESFPAEDSAAMLQDLFNCPVAMEYGSVETSLIAHTHPDNNYRVFWMSNFVEAERTDSGNTGLTVRITSLYPRCLPLVRYEIGDDVELADGSLDYEFGVDTFKRVIGRCNDFVSLPDGSVIHSEAFTHAVRSCSSINGYQVLERGPNISIHYTALANLANTQVEEIRNRLRKVHPDLVKVTFTKVDRLKQTIAGKTLMVIKESLEPHDGIAENRESASGA